MTRLNPSTIGIRWREDTGIELRCQDCVKRSEKRYWPLTEEFWDFSYGFSRCRACWLVYKRKIAAERYKNNTNLERARNRAYYAKNKRILRMKQKIARDGGMGKDACPRCGRPKKISSDLCFVCYKEEAKKGYTKDQQGKFSGRINAQNPTQNSN